MINLPQNDYLTIEKDGHTYCCCTLRQKVRHTIGLDYATRRTLYKRNGKMYFKPTRNYFNGKDEELEKLVDAGYMESRRCRITKESTTYYFTNEGLDWLEEQLHIRIRRQK
jgi:hypothetical protein